jgi:S1-C subfamily serine protease
MKLNFFYLFILLFFTNNFLYSQRSEIDFENFFFNKIENIENCEGIYELDIELTGPTFQCVFCQYYGHLVKNFDKIAIYKSNNQLKVFSLNKGVEVGSIEYDSRLRSIKFNSNGAQNFINSRFSNTLRDETVLFNEMVNYTDLYKSFESKIADKYNIKCSEYDERCNFINSIFNANAKIRKIFPNENTPPPINSKSGSGVIISPNGYIITNKHLISRPNQYGWNDFNKKWEVKFKKSNRFGNENELFFISTDIKVEIGGIEYKLIPIAVNFIEDIAILKIENPPMNLKYAVFDTLIPDLGATIYTLGYPISSTLGNSQIFTQGYVSSEMLNKTTNSNQGITKMLLLNMSINPGNSGGGVFNSKTGNLIGIATSRPNDETIGFKTEGISFATELNNIVKYVKSPFSCFKIPFIRERPRIGNSNINLWWWWENDPCLKYKLKVPIVVKNFKNKSIIPISNNQSASIQILVY